MVSWFPFTCLQRLLQRKMCLFICILNSFLSHVLHSQIFWSCHHVCSHKLCVVVQGFLDFGKGPTFSSSEDFGFELLLDFLWFFWIAFWWSKVWDHFSFLATHCSIYVHEPWSCSFCELFYELVWRWDLLKAPQIDPEEGVCVYASCWKYFGGDRFWHRSVVLWRRKMAENGQMVDLVDLFEKASKAAERAVGDGGVVGTEEVRCTEALKAMGSLPVSTAILMSTQVFNPLLLPIFSRTLRLSWRMQSMGFGRY